MTRQRLLALHRWIGLALGLHWLLLAATGCVLLFHREIEAGLIATGPAIAGVPDVERAIATARRAGATDIARVMIQGEPVRMVRIFAKRDGQSQILMLDASGGALLDATPTGGGSSRSGIIRGIYKFHQQLLLGHDGELLVGTSGLFLLTTLLIGVKIGWPGRRRWRATLAPRLLGKPWQKLFLLHRSFGLLIAAPLILSATTGAAIIWSDMLRSALHGSGAATEAADPIKGDGDIRIAPAAAIRTATAAMPRARFSRIDLPQPGEPAYVVHLRQPGELRAILGTSQVAIDGRSGAILWARDATSQRWGDRLLDALFAIHNGEWLGIGGRLIVLTTGLGLLFIVGAGFGIWWQRPARRTAARAPAKPPIPSGSLS